VQCKVSCGLSRRANSLLLIGPGPWLSISLFLLSSTLHTVFRREPNSRRTARAMPPASVLQRPRTHTPRRRSPVFPATWSGCRQGSLHRTSGQVVADDGSPAYPTDEAVLRQRITRDVKRSYYPPCEVRQGAASLFTGAIAGTDRKSHADRAETGGLIRRIMGENAGWGALEITCPHLPRSVHRRPFTRWLLRRENKS
jgi:hypothetical protein